VNVSAAQVDHEIQRGLGLIADGLNLDRAAVFEVSQNDQKLLHVHSHMAPDVTAAPTQIDFSRLSWARQKIFNGEIVMFSDPADLPAEAGAETEYLRSQGIRSAVVMPFTIGGATLGLLSLTMLRSRREWSEALIRQCGIVAEVFANALARKQHEEILVQKEMKYRTVADFTYDWEHWTKLDGTMEYVSPSCGRISGYTAQEFIDTPSLFHEIIVPEDKGAWDEHYRDSRKELKPRDLQFRIQSRDGKIRWIEHVCQPVHDDQGQPQGFRASNRDITERKRFEQALVQSKDFNQSTLDSLNYHIAVIGKEGDILGVNQSWLQFARENNAESLDRLGYGTNYLDVCRRSSETGDESALTALDGIQSVLAGSRDEFAMEYPCDSPAEKRWFLMRVTQFSGRKGGAIISHSDITNRKLAEIKLRAAYSEIEQLKNHLEAETAYLQEEIKLEHNFESIIGDSAALQYVLYKVEQVAATDTTVLVLGETGTGKELISRAIHTKSLRKARPLVKVNCATLPSHLIESELFGHERGAFTGAHSRQTGRFEVADGTSIFLDEIGELPLELQTKLLQVLQDGKFERLGSSRTIKVDVRVIAATNRDLEAEVRKGRFREDLFYRLNVFPITVPPLRQRTEDIPLLARFFIERVSKRVGKTITQIPAGIMQKLQDYPWPGNVRELENVIERAVINSSGPKLRLADDLAGPVRKETPTRLKSLQAMEKDHITRVLEETNWRIDGPKGAALILDMNPSTLRSRMSKLGIQKP
jgi:PAS domain S-box-containing protein